MAFTGRIRFTAETGLRDLVEETEASASSPRAHTLIDTNFNEVIHLDVAPSTAWAKDDVVAGITSGATCIVAARLTSLTYAVKNRIGTYTLGEVVGVVGNTDKQADQGVTKPTFVKKDREGYVTYTYDSDSDGHAVTVSAYTAPAAAFVP